MESSAKSNLEHGVFAPTRWSVVLSAGQQESPDAQAALETLCTAYWRPVYCCVRHKGYPPADAQDLTQGFFARLLAKSGVSGADPSKGAFRNYLLRSLENFLHNEHERKTARKRGGDREIVPLDTREAEEGYLLEPPDGRSPDWVFDRQWAVALLRTVMVRLRDEFLLRGRPELFEALEPNLWRDADRDSAEELGRRLAMSAGAVRVELSRLRVRYRQILRDEVLHTVKSEDQVDIEMAHLRQILAG